MNDDNNVQPIDQKSEEDMKDEKIDKASSNMNDNSKSANVVPEPINKTPSHTNVFTRLFQSEMHVE